MVHFQKRHSTEFSNLRFRKRVNWEKYFEKSNQFDDERNQNSHEKIKFWNQINAPKTSSHRSHKFFSICQYFIKIFTSEFSLTVAIKNPRNIPKIKISNSGDFLLGNFTRFSNLNPDPRKFGIFGIFRIYIPILGIPGFPGFSDLVEYEKYRSRIPEIGIRDPERIPSRSQLW